MSGLSCAPSPLTVHPLLTAADVARVLQVGERTVWRMASRSRAGVGAFPKPIRIGPKSVRWRWQDIERYLRHSAEKSLDAGGTSR